MRSVVLIVAGLLGVSSVVAEDAARVQITGGADSTGQVYTWRVTNLSESRIVSVGFPHFHGDNFTVPEGWSQEATGLAQAGAKDAHLGGVARAYVDDPKRGIGRRLYREFSLRIARAGAERRRGDVTVRFADGSEAIVSDVELPSKKSFGEQYIMAIGLALIFVVIFLTSRGRSKPDQPAAGA